MVLNYDTIGGRKTYHVIAGKTWRDLVSNYVSLTGKQPLPPRWAFGNFAQSIWLSQRSRGAQSGRAISC